MRTHHIKKLPNFYILLYKFETSITVYIDLYKNRFVIFQKLKKKPTKNLRTLIT